MREAYDEIFRVLRRKFGTDFMTLGPQSLRRGEEHFFVDALAANRSRKEIYLLGERPDFGPEALALLLGKLELLPHYFEEYADHRRFGIVVAQRVSDEMRELVLSKGLYLAYLDSAKFRLQAPRGFVPKDYRQASDAPPASLSGHGGKVPAPRKQAAASEVKAAAKRRRARA